MKKFMALFFLLSVTLAACNTTQFNDFNGLWPHGHVPYTLTGFSLDECIVIWAAISAWETASRGKVKFVCVQVADDKHLLDTVKPLKIIKWDMLPRGVDGSSTRGWGGRSLNYVLLKKVTPYIVMHELAHTLGLGHEHSRPDSFLYVTVLWDNVRKYRVNPNDFAPDKPLYDYTKYPYDYKSITHYKVMGNPCHNGVCIPQLLDAHGLDAGGETISALDADKIYRMYLKEESKDQDGD